MSKTSRKKLPKFTLKGMTCSQLADILSNPAADRERKQLTDLRVRYSYNGMLDRLRLCGNLPAVSHAKWMQTARHLETLPSIKLMVGGGKPDSNGFKLPPYSRTLKAMGAANRITVLRWGRGAYQQAQPEKTND